MGNPENYKTCVFVLIGILQKHTASSTSIEPPMQIWTNKTQMVIQEAVAIVLLSNRSAPLKVRGARRGARSIFVVLWVWVESKVLPVYSEPQWTQT